MHAMQPPQHRYVMENDVLRVDHEIKRDHAERDRRRARQAQQDK